MPDAAILGGLVGFVVGAGSVAYLASLEAKAIRANAAWVERQRIARWLTCEALTRKSRSIVRVMLLRVAGVIGRDEVPEVDGDG